MCGDAAVGVILRLPLLDMVGGQQAESHAAQDESETNFGGCEWLFTVPRSDGSLGSDHSWKFDRVASFLGPLAAEQFVDTSASHLLERSVWVVAHFGCLTA